MSLKEQEQKILKKIEEQGLRRIVKHEYYNPPFEMEIFRENGKKDKRQIKTKTVVLLEKIKKKGYPISNGEAMCSMGDIWNKRLGRIIATGRAMKNLAKGL